MQRIWFFDFESRQWSSRLTSGGRNDWTFGHAIRRSKYMYAYGTHHGAQTEESVAEVGRLSACSMSQVLCMDSAQDKVLFVAQCSSGCQPCTAAACSMAVATIACKSACCKLSAGFVFW